VGNDQLARDCRPVMSAIRSVRVPPVRADFRIWRAPCKGGAFGGFKDAVKKAVND
jgi:hypothetical protein